MAGSLVIPFTPKGFYEMKAGDKLELRNYKYDSAIGATYWLCDALIMFKK